MKKVMKNKEGNLLIKAALIIVGIFVSVLVGVGIIYVSGSIAFSSAMQPQNTIPIILFCLIGALLTYAGYRLSLTKKNYVFRAARIVFIVGLSGVGLISICTLVYLGTISHGNSISCTDNVKDQVQKSLSATLPIATDLGTGTGFYVSADEKIVTADHVVDGAKEIYINYATSKVPLQVIDRAPDYDLALLAPLKRIGSISYLELNGDYRAGDDVIAVGYPGNSLFAGQASISRGIVSRVVGPDDLKLNEITAPTNLEFVQTDSAVNPGNSGGALIGVCGVVGVMSAKSDSSNLRDYGISSEEGISFAVSAKSLASRFSLPIK